jgi:hypothetical protein
VHAVVILLTAWFDNPASAGPESERAVRLLEARGLNRQTIAQAQRCLRALEQPEGLETQWLEQQADDHARADAALWLWFLEWSHIARFAIKERSLLRLLGFKASDPATPGGDEPEVDG